MTFFPRTFSGFFLTFSILAVQPAWSKDCYVPSDSDAKSGSNDESAFEFEYHSYVWDDPKGDYSFGRCVFNHRTKPIWIKWEGLNLKGVIKGSNSISKVFPSETDDKKTKTSDLYYGARPDEINPEAIYRLNEESSSIQSQPKIWRANFSNESNLSSALESPSDFARELEELVDFTGNEKVQFQSRSYARVALPRNRDIFNDIMENGDESDVENDDFFTVEIYAGERYFSSEEQIYVDPYLFISVAKEDIPIFLESDQVAMNFSGSDDRFLSYFPELSNDSSTFSNPRMNYNTDVGSVRVDFPARRVESQIVLRFDEYATVEMPILILAPNGL